MQLQGRVQEIITQSPWECQQCRLVARMKLDSIWVCLHCVKTNVNDQVRSPNESY